jgi:2-iminobutanoate/2-iminopropanoate deaminase
MGIPRTYEQRIPNMRESITLPGHPEKWPCFSDVVKAKGTLVFLAGQVGWDDHGVWAEGFEKQAELALQNMERALAAAGATIDDVVKVVVFVADARNGDADYRTGNNFNEIYSRFFKRNFPVRTRVQTGMLARDCLVEIDVIAVISDD